MFGKPLLAHPAVMGGIHATWHAHSGDGGDRDQRDDDADDEQHRVLAVIRPLSAYRYPCTSTDPLSVRLCTGVERVNAVAARDSQQQIGLQRPPSERCGLCVHSGTAPFSARRVLFWHATRIARGRPGHRLGFGGVDRWPRREPEFTIELGCPSWRRRPPADRHDVAVERSSPKSVREHSGGTPMTDQAAIVADPEAELRWRKWQARGAEGDRRTAKRMRGLMILIAAALLVWFVVQLA